MVNPARTLAHEFARHSQTTLLGVGILLSLVDLVALFGAATKDGVLRIGGGVGFLNHYGLFSTFVGNAISLYAARKYYDGVCSIRKSKALIDKSAVQSTLLELQAMIKGDRHYYLSVYLLAIFGALCWWLNLRIHLEGNAVNTWGYVFDTMDHPWSFVAMRVHNLYTWVIIMPLIVHVMIFSSIKLKHAITIASVTNTLRYDLLNPDHRGGFGFVDTSLIAFNIVAALIYIQVTLHYETFGRLNLQHVVDYIVVTVTLLAINRMFFADVYKLIKAFRFEALNRVKDHVFKNDVLSFEVLKYCYERRMHTSSIASVAIKASAIAVPALVKYWPAIVRALTRG